jgi:IS30 family transposase
MSHLTYEQRYAISVMLKAKYRQKQIAEAMDKDKSVVSREIARNCDKRNGNYDADLAEGKYEKRRDSKPKKVYFTAEIQEMVEDKLAKKYSPDQIVGVAKKEGVACVSHEVSISIFGKTSVKRAIYMIIYVLRVKEIENVGQPKIVEVLFQIGWIYPNAQRWLMTESEQGIWK